MGPPVWCAHRLVHGTSEAHTEDDKLQLYPVEFYNSRVCVAIPCLLIRDRPAFGLVVLRDLPRERRAVSLSLSSTRILYSTCLLHPTGQSQCVHVHLQPMPFAVAVHS